MEKRTGRTDPGAVLASVVTVLPFSYIILDLETTGGAPLHDRIIEIALIRFEEGTESERWETLVNPDVSIPLSSRA